eukprot:COSAG03_NODE_116_length_12390_cov_34.697258_7_plen_89_part_00
MFTKSGRSSLLRPAARRRGFGVARGREEYAHHLLVVAHQCSRAPQAAEPAARAPRTAGGRIAAQQPAPPARTGTIPRPEHASSVYIVL